MSMLDRFDRYATKLETDAAGIRGRVSRASAASQRIMQNEAATLERAARGIREQIAAAQAQADDEVSE